MCSTNIKKGEIMMRGKLSKVLGGVVFLLAGMSLQAGMAQEDMIVLDNMAQYYEPVEFGHSMHVNLLGDNSCATCHHHTVGTQLVDENCLRCHVGSSETDSAACRDCHPIKRFSAAYLAEIENDIHLYHEDKPGLKGAFHQRCLGCHKEMDAATDCMVCHDRNEAGDKFFYSGKYAPAAEDSSSGH